jgi:predicted amidophosphoribosyltransferase
MAIANCQKCNKLFQRTNASLCPACQQESVSNVSVVYRYIYDHPNQTVEEIATQCKVSLKELEAMLASGKLGTAAQHIIFHCQSCSRTIPAVKRKGHFCPTCASKLEVKSSAPEKAPADKQAPKAVKESHDTKPRLVDDSAPIGSNNNLPIPSTESAHQKAESVSSSSDSYGFTRGSEK